MKDSITRNKTLYFAIGILLLLVLWYLGSITIDNSGVVPTINEVTKILFETLSKANTYSIIGFTLFKIIITVAISLIIAIILASISLINYRFEYLIKPIIVFMRVVPIVSIAMLILILFFKQDIRYIGTMVITSFVVIPIIYEGIMTGFKNIDSTVKDYTKTISNIDFKVITSVHIPLAMPIIISSIVQSFGLGLKVMVMSEVLCNANNSIGKIIGEYATYGEMGYCFSWTIILIVIVLIVDLILKLITKNKGVN